jgi:hypothetical protein
MSGFDAIAALSAAGIAVDAAPDGQRTVLASLSEPEVAVLAGLKARLDEAGPEVAGHSESGSGGTFW